MAKGKVSVNITKSEYVYIDGKSGRKLTKEEFTRKHGGLRSVMGGNRIKAETKARSTEDK